MITFTAYGVPVPKGSTRAFMPKGARFPVVTEDNERTRPWAAIVKDAAHELIGSDRVLYPVEPICVRAMFYLPRPISLPRRVLFHLKKPDLDKLQRAVLDALKGVVWRDDAQVMRISAGKDYTGGMPRAEIEIFSIFETERKPTDIDSKRIAGIEQLGLRAHGMGQ